MPTAYVDMIGTFFSLEPLRQRLVAIGAPEHALDLWLAEGLRESFALSLSGGYVPLADILAAALPRTLAMAGSRVSQDPSRHELVLKGLRVLNPTEGAAESCERLARGGYRLVAMSNSTEEHVRSLLERAGLLGRFAAVVTGELAGATTPHPDVYALARDQHGGDGWYITAHAWDAMGARRAGFRTVWISKKEKRFFGEFPPPDLEAPDLLSCARVLESRARALAPAAVGT